MRIYKNPAWIRYYSERYKKWLSVPPEYLSDGATGVINISEKAWNLHDWGCGNWLGKGPKPPHSEWDDGSKLTNWQLSMIYHDVLMEEGYWWIAKGRFLGTFLFGGGYARKNGMFRLHNVK